MDRYAYSYGAPTRGMSSNDNSSYAHRDSDRDDDSDRGYSPRTVVRDERNSQGRDLGSGSDLERDVQWNLLQRSWQRQDRRGAVSYDPDDEDPNGESPYTLAERLRLKNAALGTSYGAHARGGHTYGGTSAHTTLNGDERVFEPRPRGTTTHDGRRRGGQELRREDALYGSRREHGGDARGEMMYAPRGGLTTRSRHHHGEADLDEDDYRDVEVEDDFEYDRTRAMHRRT